LGQAFAQNGVAVAETAAEAIAQGDAAMAEAVSQGLAQAINANA